MELAQRQHTPLDQPQAPVTASSHLRLVEPSSEVKTPNAERAEAEEQFLEHLGFIERVSGSVCQRNVLFGADAEDFNSWVKLKLIERDYAVLRKHRQQSRLSTYLTVVIHNLFRDFRIKMWGKWRPSAKAKRLGETVTRLETLTQRDGYSLEEAIELLRTNFQVQRSRIELIDLAATLPHRYRRIFEGDELLQDQPVPADAEERLVDRHRATILARIQEVLNQSLQTLTTKDRLVLKMHYVDGYPLSVVARILHLDQRRLYRRREKCMKQLKSCFESRGLAWQDVRLILGWERTEFRAQFHR